MPLNSLRDFWLSSCTAFHDFSVLFLHSCRSKTGTRKSLAEGTSLEKGGRSNSAFAAACCWAPGIGMKAKQHLQGEGTQGLGVWQMAQYLEVLSLAAGCEQHRNPANSIFGSSVLGESSTQTENHNLGNVGLGRGRAVLGAGCDIGVTSALALAWGGGSFTLGAFCGGFRLCHGALVGATPAPAVALLGLQRRQRFFTSRRIF